MDECWNDKFIKEKCYSVDNDRFKEKSYVFTPFPEASLHGFQTAKIREMILADIVSRYKRMQNVNVLMPTGFQSLSMASFLEAKRMFNSLSDESTDIFYRQMSNLGIGISDSRCINMRHAEYVSILQNSFIELYERNYIQYKTTSVFYDKEENQVYDYMEAPQGMKKSPMKCFVLEVGGLIPQIMQDIDSLSIPEESKEEMRSAFQPVDVMSMSLAMSNGEMLEVEMENPEYTAGISYIFLNPEFMDVSPYVSHDEYGSVEQYRITGEGLYAYSGLSARNPLTGEDIPVFISMMYPASVYLGIPDVDEDDMALATSEGFPEKHILEDGILVNSDMLDGYSPSEGRRKIIGEFTDADMAKCRKVYQNHEIVLSSLEPFGALIPFLEDKGKLSSLKDFLPYSFSSQFRPVLGADVDVSGTPVSGTISHLFTEGMEVLLSMVYDDIGSMESLFSDETREILSKWLPVSESFISSDDLIPQVLMPLVLYNIIKKEESYMLPPLYKKLFLLPRVIDVKHRAFRRKNNNLLDMDKWIEKYGCDAIRYLCAESDPACELVFNPFRLEDLGNSLQRIRSCLLSSVEDKIPSLDYYFHKLLCRASECLADGDVMKYTAYLQEFNERVLFKEIISKSQVLTYICVIYPVFPYLAEEIYEKVFDGRYSLLNEGWPQE